jgi:hypothetical protein
MTQYDKICFQRKRNKENKKKVNMEPEKHLVVWHRIKGTVLASRLML